jgi:hypothetical protein
LAVGRQELDCTPISVRNADSISGVRAGVVVMGEEYSEEDAGDARRVDAKNCPLSSAIRGAGARSIELEETTEVSSGCRIKGTAITEGERCHYKR